MAVSNKSNLPGGQALVIEDDDGRPNKLRVVEYDGRIFVEASAKYDGGTYHILVRVPRLRFVPLLLGWLGL